MFATQTDEGLVELPDLATVPIEAVRTALRVADEDQVWVLLELLAPPETMAVLDLLSMSTFQTVLRLWEDDSEVKVGEVLRVGRLIEKHSEALDADLIGKGLRLRHFPSDEFTWHDLKVIVRHLSVHSSLYAAVYPDQAGWDMQNLLLANIADSLVWLQWAQTENGKKGRNRPQPIPRPGIKPPHRDGAKPKASTLSAIKEKFAQRYSAASRAPSKTQAIQDLFGRR